MFVKIKYLSFIKDTEQFSLYSSNYLKKLNCLDYKIFKLKFTKLNTEILTFFKFALFISKENLENK